ncbi:hypothetical protein ACFC1R_11325 [Kitasatospora sp. NPDC056138]
MRAVAADGHRDRHATLMIRDVRPADAEAASAAYSGAARTS